MERLYKWILSKNVKTIPDVFLRYILIAMVLGVACSITAIAMSFLMPGKPALFFLVMMFGAFAAAGYFAIIGWFGFWREIDAVVLCQKKQYTLGAIEHFIHKTNEIVFQDEESGESYTCMISANSPLNEEGICFHAIVSNGVHSGGTLMLDHIYSYVVTGKRPVIMEEEKS